MKTDAFNDVVKTEAELREIIGHPHQGARKKDIGVLDEHCKNFIARSPFLLLSTSGADGRCDVSPKGDAPGFVLVLDERRLVIPDRLGNRRLDGMSNLVANPHIGPIFLIPGMEETLRVNGRGSIVRDASLLDQMVVNGKRPQLAIGVEVEECFIHCAKAFKRSGLWDPATWPAKSELPRAAQILLDHIRPEGVTVDQLECQLEEGYRTRLY